jgi:hypothetical protein
MLFDLLHKNRVAVNQKLVLPGTEKTTEMRFDMRRQDCQQGAIRFSWRQQT